jgi:hypothetical protein
MVSSRTVGGGLWRAVRFAGVGLVALCVVGVSSGTPSLASARGRQASVATSQIRIQPPSGSGGTTVRGRAWGLPESAGSSEAEVSAQIQVRPPSGPAGLRVRVRGSGFLANYGCPIWLSFIDSRGTSFTLSDQYPPSNSFVAHEVIPASATPGAGTVTVEQFTFYTCGPLCRGCKQPPVVSASASFTVMQADASGAGQALQAYGRGSQGRDER